MLYMYFCFDNMETTTVCLRIRYLSDKNYGHYGLARHYFPVVVEWVFGIHLSVNTFY